MPSSRPRIANPVTGRMVYRAGAVGRAIIATRKSMKKKPKKNPTSKRGKGQCTRRKSNNVCFGDPNCEWRPKSRTCVRKKGVLGDPRTNRKPKPYYGPVR